MEHVTAHGGGVTMKDNENPGTGITEYPNHAVTDTCI